MTPDPFLFAVELPMAIEDRIQYPFSIPAIHDLHHLKLDSKVTYFVGENGSGKSTLLEAIAVACGFNPEGGTRNFHFHTRESHSILCTELRLIRSARRVSSSDGFFYRAESFFNVASYIDEIGVGGSYGGRSLHHVSHGESFLQFVLNRLGGNGIYLFDEPESALSPQRQLTFLSALHRLVRRGSQMIIATHSPIVLAYPNSTIYQFGASGIESVDYHDTETYRVTRSFLSRKEWMLRELLDDSL